MYQDLRNKLSMYGSGRIKPAGLPGNSGPDIHDILDGTVCSNDDGNCFVIENGYPFTYLYGGYNLGRALDINMLSLKRVYNDLDQDLNITDFLFLDIETTGLSGGAGTVAFLIGAGFYEKGVFKIRQYFMRDYDEEPALLRFLNGLFSGYKGLVTFNGKAFDWNILQTRFTFNRISPALKEPAHIDLLFPSRRIWKLKLESCRLTSLEENILGETRVDDIPGAMIPGAYFKYLVDRDATEMKRVIKHNELDILTMVSLLAKIFTILENPLSETDGEQELLGLGRIFETGGECGTVIDCYETCMKSGNFTVKDTASKRLAGIYKKSRNYKKAAEYWENMLSGTETPDLHPVIELAKFYEHREKNIPRALEMVEKAVSISSRMGFMNNMQYEELKIRFERLKRKAEKKT